MNSVTRTNLTNGVWGFVSVHQSTRGATRFSNLSLLRSNVLFVLWRLSASDECLILSPNSDKRFCSIMIFLCSTFNSSSRSKGSVDSLFSLRSTKIFLFNFNAIPSQVLIASLTSWVDLVPQWIRYGHYRSLVSVLRTLFYLIELIICIYNLSFFNTQSTHFSKKVILTLLSQIISGYIL